jgi:hypothetical protein
MPGIQRGILNELCITKRLKIFKLFCLQVDSIDFENVQLELALAEEGVGSVPETEQSKCQQCHCISYDLPYDSPLPGVGQL